ncbi:transglutaminase-like domain-containing protein [Microbacter margulisiae]|uniref:Transglutaminase-like putative cysteine protease n=1 Tax=Microbacter margulisiae TaxID=1350067 RepID=A0A7W5DUX6_9PORP|nr:transglutaminase domain-containing protein [Microbacter margulisiae]MBB3188638.1 transglutaminase-like putative cysteine protease [Microbacter margulisiae]
MQYQRRNTIRRTQFLEKAALRFLPSFYVTLVVFLLFNLSLAHAANTKNTNALHLFDQGEFIALKHLQQSIHTANNCSQEIDSLVEISHRIEHDFSLTETEVDSLLQKQGIFYTPSEKTNWESKGWLEYKVINRKKRYFSRSVSNLKLRLQQVNDSITHSQAPLDNLTKFRLKHTAQIIAQTTRNGGLSVPVNYKVTYTISVNPDAVPAGDTVRCWMPYPKQDHTRQTDVHLLSTFPSRYFIAPDSVGQRSIYFEQKAKQGEPTIFRICFTYRSYAQSFDLSKIHADPYDTSSPIYKTFTREQPPHIVFTKEIRQLADSITKGETNPVGIVTKLYKWIDHHIIWSGALEYSTISNIPHYVLKNHKGDCGMQTLLFMSMARYKGIPVKWQSGWMMHPGEVNLHDWCEVYYKGIGWVPVDVSFGLQPSGNKRIRDFYMSGIDSYRLIINDAISAPFIPTKKFMRSEPIDFQRGEVETSKGNLYFDQWKYSMQVEYLK